MCPDPRAEVQVCGLSGLKVMRDRDGGSFKEQLGLKPEE